MLFGFFSKNAVSVNLKKIPEGPGRRRSWGRSSRIQDKSINLSLLLNFYNKRYYKNSGQKLMRFFFKRKLPFRLFVFYIKKRSSFIGSYLFFNLRVRLIKINPAFIWKLDLLFTKYPLLGSKPRNNSINEFIDSNRLLLNNFSKELPIKTKFQNKLSIWPLASEQQLDLLYNNQIFYSKKLHKSPCFYTLFLKGPKLFAQLGTNNKKKTSPLLVLTSTETALMLNGLRSHWNTPLVQTVIFTSMRRALLAANIRKIILRMEGAIRGIKHKLQHLMVPANEVFTQPIIGDVIWDISLGPWISKPTETEFTSSLLKLVELTPELDPSADWIQSSLKQLITKGYCKKYKKIKFLYKLYISEIYLRPGKNYSNVYSHLWRRKLRSLARRQTKRLVRQTCGRFWLKQS